jgi:hypothetical protein
MGVSQICGGKIVDFITADLAEHLFAQRSRNAGNRVLPERNTYRKQYRDGHETIFAPQQPSPGNTSLSCKKTRSGDVSESIVRVPLGVRVRRSSNSKRRSTCQPVCRRARSAKLTEESVNSASKPSLSRKGRLCARNASAGSSSNTNEKSPEPFSAGQPVTSRCHSSLGEPKPHALGVVSSVKG